MKHFFLFFGGSIIVTQLFFWFGYATRQSKVRKEGLTKPVRLAVTRWVLENGEPWPLTVTVITVTNGWLHITNEPNVRTTIETPLTAEQIWQ